MMAVRIENDEPIAVILDVDYQLTDECQDGLIG
jgi:hypothetical protein